MSGVLKKIFSFILCAGILAPIIEKSIHSYGHRNDVHCTSASKHFHEHEHNCSVCDYELPAQLAQSSCCDFKVYCRSFLYVNNYHNSFTAGDLFFSTSRAPPVQA
ncbi:MAG: hypothetical protein HYU69_14215 [Bacteroidetes bacterium]|nr:hypothetical protein [Bacteroidota bacterium]